MNVTEWIEWSGGKMPVANGTLVDVEHRGGEIFRHKRAGSGAATDWSRRGVQGDIVRYRVHKGGQEKDVSKCTFNNYAGGPMHDPVSRPSHYTGGGIECIDAIEAAFGHEGAADFCRGNVIKYAWRAASKGGADDMRKAAWYSSKAAELMDKHEGTHHRA